MKDEKVYISQKKYDELESELKALKTVRRKEIAEKLEYAKSLGDLSENAEYQQAREEQANIEDRIKTVEGMLKSASIITGGGGTTVDIGSTIVVEKTGTSDRQTYHVVGSEEADMDQHRISNRSPLGEAALGKKKGDVFTVQAPQGAIDYKLLDIK